MARDFASHPQFEADVTWHVSTRTSADADLLEAQDWYEQQRPGLGDEFLLAMAEVFVRLETSPLEFPVYYQGFCRALARRFPYKFFFRIEGEVVIVFRILHAAREHEWRLK